MTTTKHEMESMVSIIQAIRHVNAASDTARRLELRVCGEMLLALPFLASFAGGREIPGIPGR